MSVPTILVVDDDAAKQLSLRAALEPLGHPIVSVDSGQAALRAVMEQTFAVILMDVQMQGMDGYETARFIRMREVCEHTPIVFITAFTLDEAQVPAAYASGAVDFIFAPIEPSILRARVSIFVDLFVNAEALAQTLRDVTLLSERSRDTEARTRTVLEHVADGIVTVNDAGVIESFNRAATRIFGYSEQEAIGLAFTALLAPEYRHLTPHDHTAELMGCRSDETTFPMELDLSDVRVGARTTHIGCIRDVSERRHAEQQLQDVARFFEMSHDMVCTADADGTFVELNGAWERTLGFTQAQLRAEPFIAFVHPDDVECTANEFKRLSEGEDTDVFLNRFRTSDGGWRWLEWTSTADLDTSLIYASARDVTERIEAQDRLRKADAVATQARDEALEASRLKSAFVANMSHEIRTPLNGVLGMTDRLLATNLNAGQRESARLVKISGDSLLTIIDDILDFSKIEAGALEIEAVPFDLIEAIEDVCDLVAVAAARKGLRLSVSLDPDLPEITGGDPVRVRQVLTNLLSNAVKFTAEGEIIISARCEPGESGRPVVRFDVSDTGIGIPDDRLDLLFESFSQADVSTTRRFGGTGLGLAIAKQLVELMGGTIGATSRLGQGTVFSVTLPLAAAEPQPAAESQLSEVAGLRLLAIDETALNRDLLVRSARHWDVDTTAAASGPEALMLLREAASRGEPFDCVALDLSLPGMSGLQLAAAIRADDDIPAPGLMMFASDSEQRGAVRDAGIEVFVAKPVTRARLLDALRDATGIERGRRQPAAGGQIGAGRRILVAEDNEINAALVVHMLKDRGYEVSVTANGREALLELLNNGYDAVLMDCQMPELDGYDATLEVRRREGTARHTPIIAMTAHALRGDRERCLEAGMDDYLAKPLRAEEFDRVLTLWAPGDEEATSPPALDPEALDRLCEELGDPAMLARLADLFDSHTPTILADLHNAVKGGDAEVTRQLSHKLKGSCASVAALSMADLCGRLELAAADGIGDAAHDWLGQLTASFAPVSAALRREAQHLQTIPVPMEQT